MNAMAMTITEMTVCNNGNKNDDENYDVKNNNNNINQQHRHLQQPPGKRGIFRKEEELLAQMRSGETQLLASYRIVLYRVVSYRI